MEKNGLIGIVGNENVLDSPAILEEYTWDMSFNPRVRPMCVVRPGNAEQVQLIVKWANNTGTPLVPVSSGPPHFRGDTVPKVGGAVIVDMSGMKKVMMIDVRNRVAMVEPGVTFGELQAELEKRGLSAYTPLCPRASKSVLASMLEREPITMPAHHWDCTDPFLCGEIIFGTGDILRSGEAAGPESTEEKWKLGSSQMCAFANSQFDENKLISGAQGTMGIITWATLKCRMASKFSKTYLVPSNNLEPLLDLSYRILRTRQCDHCFILNDLNLACLLASDGGDAKALRDSCAAWSLVVSFEGNGELPKDKVAWQDADFMDVVSRIGDLTPTAATPGGRDLSRILAGPSEEPYWKLRYKGGCGEVFFLTTLDKTPGFVDSFSSLAQARRYSSREIGVYIQPVVQGTSCHCEFDLFYETGNAADTERVKWLVTQGAASLADMGAFFSRPYGTWAKTAYGHAVDTAIMLKKVKKIFDPKDVMNPGQLCF